MTEARSGSKLLRPYGEMGLLQAHAGGDPTPTFAAAEVQADRIDDIPDRSRALRQIGMARAKCGLDPEALFNSVRNLALTVEDHLLSVHLLVALARAEADGGHNPFTTIEEAGTPLRTVSRMQKISPKPKWR